MKKSIKAMSFAAVVVGSIVVAGTGCQKDPLSENSPSAVSNAKQNGPSSSYQSITGINEPTIYGIGFNLFGSSGMCIYEIDRTTGQELWTTEHQITFGGVQVPNVYGIAKIPGGTTALCTAIDDITVCGTGTALYNVSLSTGAAARLGVCMGLPTTITDIEYNPVTNTLYGICGNLLVRIGTGGMGGLGTSCVNGGTPATVAVLGYLDNVGVGPYAISFNYLGDCAIMSAKDHKRAYVTVPSSGSATNPIAVSGTVVQALTPDLYSVSETGSCISGTTQFVAIAGQTNSSPSSYMKAFYQWAGTSPSLYYQYKGNYCCRDYTSAAQNPTVSK